MLKSPPNSRNYSPGRNGTGNGNGNGNGSTSSTSGNGSLQDSQLFLLYLLGAAAIGSLLTNAFYFAWILRTSGVPSVVELSLAAPTLEQEFELATGLRGPIREVTQAWQRLAQPDPEPTVEKGRPSYHRPEGPTISSLKQRENLEVLNVNRRAKFAEHFMNAADFDIRPFFFDDQDFEVDLERISVATQTGFDPTKLTRLIDLSTRWQGYISAVVYFDNRHRNDALVLEGIQTLRQFRSEHMDLFENRVIFHLVIDNRIPKSDDLYPHNILRNLSIQYALTDAINLSDVDFIPCANSHDNLQQQIRNLDFWNEELPKALILPAFERELGENENEQDITYRDLPPTKEDFIQILSEFIQKRDFRESTFKPFHYGYYPGHGPTNFMRWFGSTEEYRIEYELFFEPYFVVPRSENLPPLWEHFSGFGRNKQSWVEELGLADYEFHVDPKTFLIHINHDYAKQDFRQPRPSVVKEYGRPFQDYLYERYQATFWNEKELDSSIEAQTNTYYKKTLHFCRSRQLVFADTASSESNSVTVDIPYQCKGSHYNDFGEHLFQFVISGSLDANTGTQSSPLPANSKVLALGNSHTQQILDALVCQYNSLVEEAVILDETKSPFKRDQISQVRFKNNATIFNLVGQKATHNITKWQKTAEKLTQHKLSDFNAIIMGDLQELKKGKASKNDVISVTPADIVAAFEGPVIFTGSFSVEGVAHLEAAQETQRAMEASKRLNVEAMDGREFVPLLGECGSETADPTKVKLCDGRRSAKSVDLPEGVHPETMHRCVGLRGGHPDLLSWQVIEFLHRQIVIEN